MAAILSLGYKLPMAQYFLGNLYFRLDEIHVASARSGGRYDLGSYVPSSFLTMFLYERFRGFGPEVENIPFDKEEVPIRIERWHNALGTNDLSFYIDNETDFIFRPYCTSGPYWTYPFFEKETWVYEHPVGLVNTWLSGTKAATLNVAFPAFLPYIADDGEGHVRYNPHRCWRQLGFDQVVPVEYFDGEVGKSDADRLAWSFHTRENFYKFCDRYDGQEMPSSGREGNPSVQWYLFWVRQAQLFLTYVYEAPEVPNFPLVSTVSDNVLRKQKTREPSWRGSLSSFSKTAEEAEPVKNDKSTSKEKAISLSSKSTAASKKTVSSAPSKQVLPPPPPTRARSTRATSKKRSRDEDLSNFTAVEEETSHAKRNKALEQIRQANKKHPNIVEEGSPVVQGKLTSPPPSQSTSTIKKVSGKVRATDSRADNDAVNPLRCFRRLQDDLNYSNEHHYASERMRWAYDIRGIADEFRSSVQVFESVEEDEEDSATLREMIERAKSVSEITSSAVKGGLEKNIEEEEGGEEEVEKEGREEGNSPVLALMPPTRMIHAPPSFVMEEPSNSRIHSSSA